MKLKYYTDKVYQPLPWRVPQSMYFVDWRMFFFINEYPSVAIANKELVEKARARNAELRVKFWNLQGEILGSMAEVN